MSIGPGVDPSYTPVKDGQFDGLTKAPLRGASPQRELGQDAKSPRYGKGTAGGSVPGSGPGVAGVGTSAGEAGRGPATDAAVVSQIAQKMDAVPTVFNAGGNLGGQYEEIQPKAMHQPHAAGPMRPAKSGFPDASN